MRLPGGRPHNNVSALFVMRTKNDRQKQTADEIAVS